MIQTPRTFPYYSNFSKKSIEKSWYFELNIFVIFRNGVYLVDFNLFRVSKQNENLQFEETPQLEHFTSLGPLIHSSTSLIQDIYLLSGLLDFLWSLLTVSLINSSGFSFCTFTSKNFSVLCRARLRDEWTFLLSLDALIENNSEGESLSIFWYRTKLNNFY